MVIRKNTDSRENMVPAFYMKKSNIVVALVAIFLLSIVSYISIGIIQREQERQRIDEIVNSIQNEIFLKQCHLDKMYCCGYKDKEACEKWHKANCSEENGSLEINCDVKF